MAKQEAGATVETYTSAKAAGKVMIVARSTCAFCIRANQILSEFVPEDKIVLINVDKTPQGKQIREQAKKDGEGHSTLPVIFFGDTYIGGCDDVSELKTRGTLPTKLGGNLLLSQAEQRARKEKTEVRPPPGLERAFPLFYFPHTVNGNAVRGRGLVVVIICVLTIVFGIIDEYVRWTGWLNILLCCDYTVIIFAGGLSSPLGALGNCLVVMLPDKYNAGAPKQFAALCGAMFSGLTGAFLVAEWRWAGLIVSIMLLGAASLETFIDFCAGCWMFGMAITFGILSPSMHNMHIGQKLLFKMQAKNADDFSSQIKPLRDTKLQVRQHGQPMTMADNRISYPKTEDHKRRDFNPVKHVALGDFIMPLSILALAMCYHVGFYTPGLHCKWLEPSGALTLRDRRCALIETNAVWQVLFYLSLAIAVALLSLLAVKLIKYPKKFYAEMVHPIRSNGLASFPAYLLLMAFFLYDYPGEVFVGDTKSETTDEWSRTLAVICFWVGAVLLKLLMIWKMAWLVSNRADKNLTQANMLFPLIACVLAAMVAPLFEGYSKMDNGYYEIGWWFFGLSALLGVLLTGGTFLESITYHWSDERIRPSVGNWIVAMHLPFLAYLMLTGGPGTFYANAGTNLWHSYSGPVQPATNGTVPLDQIAHVLYFAGLSLFLVLAYLAFPKGFLLRLKFDFSFWQLAFPLDMLTVSTFAYLKALHNQSTIKPNFINGLAYGFLALTTYVHAGLFFNTLFWLLKRRWLRPDYKWGPMSINLLTHEAFRFAGEGLKDAAQGLKGLDSQEGLIQAQYLAADWQEYGLVLEWHAHQEETHLFPEIDSFNPFNSIDGHNQHVYLGELEHAITEAAEKILETTKYTPEVKESIDVMVKKLEEYVPYFEKHLDWEEENLLVTNRRIFNMDIQMRIVQKIWNEYESKTVEWFRTEAGITGKPAEPLFKPLGKDEDPNILLRYPPPHVAVLPFEKRQVLRVALPWVIRHLRYPMQRARFCKALIWALPERAQHIGEMIYRGVEDHEWCAIIKDVPEIIPRGVPGWTRRM